MEAQLTCLCRSKSEYGKYCTRMTMSCGQVAQQVSHATLNVFIANCHARHGST